MKTIAKSQVHPKNGDVKLDHGIRFMYHNGVWCLDEVIDSFDSFHNYTGRQTEKKPLRTADSHLVCGTRLLRN